MTSKPSALKQLLRKVPTIEEFEQAHTELRRDGARGAVILGATIVEHQIRDLLVSRLRPDLTYAELEELFGPSRPLASFATKIKLGYAMQIYGLKTRHDLELLRELSNLFAHSRTVITFATPEVVDTLRQFICHVRREPNMRSRFISVVHILTAHLYLRRTVGPGSKMPPLD